MDEFFIEVVLLKNFDKVCVGYDLIGLGFGWFLDKVVIKDLEDNIKEYVFFCNRFGVVGFINFVINILNLVRKIMGMNIKLMVLEKIC